MDVPDAKVGNGRTKVKDLYWCTMHFQRSWDGSERCEVNC